MTEGGLEQQRFSFVTRTIEHLDLLYVRLQGQNLPLTSLENGSRLIERLNQRPYRALLMDYRHTTHMHDELQFDHLSGLLAYGFPRHLVTAHVYAPRQRANAVMMVRTLQDSGFLAGAFREHRGALAWIADALAEQAGRWQAARLSA